MNYGTNKKANTPIRVKVSIIVKVRVNVLCSDWPTPDTKQ